MSVRGMREAALQRWAGLFTERQPYLTQWQELAHYLSPRSGKFDDNAQQTPPQYLHLQDAHGTYALNILTAGLLAGASSPARPWFKLQTPDDDLNQRESVKNWLYTVERRLRQVFNQSNTYRAYRHCYKELGVFGTAGNLELPDFENVVHNHTMTAGEYAVDVNPNGEVDTVYRRLQLTVGVLVKRFGLKNCSRRVQHAYNEKRLGDWVTVLHVIEPRRERNPLKLDAGNKPWASSYYEIAADGEEILRSSGHDEFPGQFPRWDINGVHKYGDSPGQLALGYVKRLQFLTMRKDQAVDMSVRPPLVASALLQGMVDYAAGSVSYIDMANGGVKPLVEAHPDRFAALDDIKDLRMNIGRCFYNDLFLLISQDQRATPASAREVAERHEEKLLMLGPVLESLHLEMLGPHVELGFTHMLRAGAVPPPPRELEGVPLSVQFVSVLAQAQRLVGLNSVERLIGSVVNVSAVKPDILDKLDLDRAVEVYSDMLGTDPTLVVAGEQVALIRADRAEREAAAQRAAMLQQGAQVAKDMGAAGEDGRTAAVGAAQQMGVLQ